MLSGERRQGFWQGIPIRQAEANRNAVAAASRDACEARKRAVWAAHALAVAKESERDEAAARAAAAEKAAQQEEKVLNDLLETIANEAALDEDAAMEKARKEERAAAELRREEGERAAAQLGAAGYAAGRKRERERRYMQMLRQQVHVYMLRGLTVKAKEAYPAVLVKAGQETVQAWVAVLRDTVEYWQLQRKKAERKKAAEKSAKPVEKEGEVVPPAAPVPPPAAPPAAVPMVEEDEDEEPLFNVFQKDEEKAKAEEAKKREEEAKKKQDEREAKKRKRQEAKDLELAIQLVFSISPGPAGRQQRGMMVQDPVKGED
jgi:hypothetical protein